MTTKVLRRRGVIPVGIAMTFKQHKESDTFKIRVNVTTSNCSLKYM